ncbi:MAG: LLM class F420-dependent oxidoreductase [Actinomycetota bacterium]
MKLSVEYPSVAGREGPEKVLDLARAIEDIGYDEIAVFDHVVMGHPTDDRPAPMYPPRMPILEAVVLLAQIAAVTSRVSLATEVLVLPQRQPVLVAKQFATIDVLSAGRVRLGVGVGWQESEYDALEERFDNRGARMDEAIDLIRSYWRDETIDFHGTHYDSTAMAMEPKPAQGADMPIWIGGGSRAALRRVVERGDGWMGTAAASSEEIKASLDAIEALAADHGRDPSEIGLQMMLAPPPRRPEDKDFYANHDQVVARAEQIKDLGFDWLSLNATAIFQAGARSVDAMTEELNELHTKVRAAVGD